MALLTINKPESLCTGFCNFNRVETDFKTKYNPKFPQHKYQNLSDRKDNRSQKSLKAFALLVY